MELLVFTLSLFPEHPKHIHHQPESWRPLIFVTQFTKQSATLERSLNATKPASGRLVRNDHKLCDHYVTQRSSWYIAGWVLKLPKSHHPLLDFSLVINGNLAGWILLKILFLLVMHYPMMWSVDELPHEEDVMVYTTSLSCLSHTTPAIQWPNWQCKFLIQVGLERIIMSVLGPETNISNESYASSWDAYVDSNVAESSKIGNNAIKTLKRGFKLALEST
jgi:hypothetical protein